MNTILIQRFYQLNYKLLKCHFACSLTLAPMMLKCGMVEAETDAVTRAVNMEMMLIPVIIQKTQNTRPGTQFGLRSP